MCEYEDKNAYLREINFLDYLSYLENFYFAIPHFKQDQINYRFLITELFTECYHLLQIAKRKQMENAVSPYKIPELINLYRRFT